MARKPTKTKDGFQNLQANLGIGPNNLVSKGGFSSNPITRNRIMLENAYRGDWVVRACVNTIPDDMTREGIDITSDIDPKEIGRIMRSFTALRIWQSLNECLCWARLYGGSVGVIMIDGQKLDTPLRVDTVGKNQFRGICSLDRWMIQPNNGALVKTYGPHLGKPVFYDIIGDSQKLAKQRVHFTRVIRCDGDNLPYYQRLAENGWGMSVIEPIYDRVIEFNSITSGIGQLAFKAHLRTLKVDRLREIIGMGGKAYAALLTQMENVRIFQSNEGLTLLDKSDEFETHTFAFGGMADIVREFATQLSGALGIPLTRLFGVAPGGLNSTGEGDQSNYYDRIRQLQVSDLQNEMGRVLAISYRSVMGHAPKEELDFNFKSLWQMDEEKKADIAMKTTQTILQAIDSGVISHEVGLQELKQRSEITGIFSNITDDMIKQAKLEPPVPLGGANTPPAPGVAAPTTPNPPSKLRAVT
jgi:phage-related protein (TIGR01555 family)